MHGEGAREEEGKLLAGWEMEAQHDQDIVCHTACSIYKGKPGCCHFDGLSFGPWMGSALGEAMPMSKKPHMVGETQ